MRLWKKVSLVLFVGVLSTAIWVFTLGPLRFLTEYFVLKPPEPAGQVEHFEPADGLDYFVYLPPEYPAGSAEPYPVVYYLHAAKFYPWKISLGMIQTELHVLANSMETAVAGGRVRPAVIVAPLDGFGESMWSDSSSGHVQAETMLLTQLMPAIEANFNVAKTRDLTSIQGFSMGGFGAMKIGLKYPEQFGRIASWDGPMQTWQTLNEDWASIVQNMYASEADFDKHSPWTAATQSAQNGEVLPEIHMFSGKTRELAQFADNFSQHLRDLGIEHSLIEADCHHSVFCFVEPERIVSVYRADQ
jgi:S-formylglutathione hydrolase FrmB